MFAFLSVDAFSVRTRFISSQRNLYIFDLKTLIMFSDKKNNIPTPFTNYYRLVLCNIYFPFFQYLILQRTATLLKFWQGSSFFIYNFLFLFTDLLFTNNREVVQQQL